GVDRCVAQARGGWQLELGQFLDHAAGEGGALAHGADDVEFFQRRDDSIGPAEVSVEYLDVEVARNLRPVGHAEGDFLVVVENCAAVARHDECPCVGPRRWRNAPGGIAAYSTGGTVPRCGRCVRGATAIVEGHLGPMFTEACCESVLGST